MTDARYYRKLRKIRERNKQAQRINELKQERAKYETPKKKETSKMIAIYLFLLLNVIVAYALVAMWHFSDLSYLGVLISDIAAQVLVYAIYCLKAFHGKKEQEKNILERDKMSMRMGKVTDDELDDENNNSSINGDTLAAIIAAGVTANESTIL